MSFREATAHQSTDGKILQLVPKFTRPDPTKVRATPRTIVALLLQLISRQAAPVIPVLDERGNFVGARREVPQEVEEEWESLLGGADAGTVDLPTSRSFDLPAVAYAPTQISPDAASTPVTLSAFAGAMDQLVPTIGQVRRGMADLHERTVLLEEQVSADGNAPRFAAIEARAAQAEARSADLERRATAAEAQAAQTADLLRETRQQLDAAAEANRSLSERVDRFVDRALDIEARMVEDIDIVAVERDVKLTFRVNGEDVIRRAKLQYPMNRGVYRSGQAYATGDMVTFSGSTFIAERDAAATEKPESSTAWRLMVKRGRDGRNMV